MTAGRLPKLPDPLPFWFTNLNERCFLSGRDVAELFGYNHRDIKSYTAKGQLPKPDEHKGGGAGCKKAQWKKSTIMAEITRRRKLIDERSA